MKRKFHASFSMRGRGSDSPINSNSFLMRSYRTIYAQSLQLLSPLLRLSNPFSFLRMKKNEASFMFDISRNTIDLWLSRSGETRDSQARTLWQPPGNGYRIIAAVLIS